jgi:hydroxyethylthiazole kinase
MNEGLLEHWLRQDILEGLADQIGVLIRDIQMGHEADVGITARAGHDAVRLQSLTKLRRGEIVALNVKIQDVRLYAGQVDLNAGASGKSLRDLPGMAMIVSETINVVIQRVQTTGGYDSGLPHPATEHLTRCAGLLNGDPLMARVTGTGCMLGAVLGACLAVRVPPFEAAVSALVLFGVAGERAGAGDVGPGTFQVRLFDALAALGPADIARDARISP